MKLSDFYSSEYTLSYVNSLRQFWKYEKIWSCIGRPKENNIFLYLDRLSARYTLKSGEEFVAHDGDIVFCPVGSEYTVEFFDFKESGAGTVGINFMLNSCSSLPDRIECFTVPGIRTAVFEIELLKRNENKVSAKYNAILYGMMTTLGEMTDKTFATEGYTSISAGVNYLREHFNRDVKISELSAICNMSEVYFRRIFRQCMGTSPIKYRLNLRLTRASEYLRYTDISVSEISELLGFNDTSYFIKIFKQNYSVTPFAYRGKF